MTAPTANWLYAVIRDGAHPADLRGVGGGPVRLLAGAGSISAVVSTVEVASHGAAAIQRNAQDLGWLERLVREHNNVVEAYAGRTTTLPVRLGTLFTGDDAVTDLVRDRAGDLDAALDGIAGRREWGVKFYRAAEPATADDAAEPATADDAAEPATADDAAGRDGAAAAGPGTTYLLRRRAQQQAAHAADAAATAAGRATHAELARLAEDQRTYPPQDPRLDPAAAAMTLNATYLVRDDQASAFLDAIDRCRREHRAVRIEVTGPWPAYAFASMTLGAAR